MDPSIDDLPGSPFLTLQTQECLFWSPGHKATLETLAHRVETRQGFVAIVGEAGVGKTTVLHAYLAGIDPQRLQTICFIDVPLSLQGMLVSIANACGLQRTTDDIHVVADQLRQHLLEACQHNRNVALVIDEAQNLPVQILWNLCILSNLMEMSTEKLLQIILVGRPEFERTCNLPELRPLRERLGRRITVVPLTPQESRAYVRHHLQQVATHADPVFTEETLQWIIAQAQGIPRALNTICTEVLSTGVLCQQTPMATTLEREGRARVGRLRMFPLLWWGLACFVAGLLLGLVQHSSYANFVPSYFDPLALSRLAWGIFKGPQTEPVTAMVRPAAQEDSALAPTRVPLQKTNVAAVTTPSVGALPEREESARLVPPPTAVPAASNPAVFSPPQAAVPTTTDTPTMPISPGSPSNDCLVEILQGKPCAPTLAPREPDATARPKASKPAMFPVQAKGVSPPQASLAVPREPDATARPKASRPAALPVQEKGRPPSQSSLPQTTTGRVVEKPGHRGEQVDPAPSQGPLSRSLTEPAEFLTTDVVCVTPHAPDRPGKDILLIDYAGHHVQPLIADGALNLAPALSPNGTILAYTSYRDGMPNLYLRNLVTGEESRLTYGQGLAVPGAWGPNGRYLALSHSVDGNSDIFLYDVQQQQLRRLTTHSGMDIAPSFAPDSSRLVFTSDRSGTLQLYLTAVDGRPPVQLTQHGLSNTSPAWSPHGETIAFIGQSEDATQDLYVIQANGTGLRRLTWGQQFQDTPTWAPDGRFVMGTSVQGTVWERYLVQVDGIGATRLLPRTGPVCLAPQWVARQP